MRRAERLYRLVNEMRTRRVTRASDLADTLEVSVSTIYRDVAHLQASGVAIDGAAGVGYRLQPGFDLPNVAYTHDQIDALAAGLAFVERTGDPVLAAAAREVRAKIQAGMPQPEMRQLADAPFYSLHHRGHAASDADSVRRAIRERWVARISYRDGDGQMTERHIQPLVIWDLPDGWMVSAWCELREDFRTFRSDRIASLALIERRFADTETTGLKTFLARERCERADE
ncbi:YafY family protein [Gammaproteobacteria bacterium]|nr:YafY family protein [Gammaproteobacteria bacterium]